MTYYMVYARYGLIEKRSHETFKDAVDDLQIGTEFGEIFALGIADMETNTVYVSSSEVFGIDRESLRSGLLKEIEDKLNIKASNVEEVQSFRPDEES